MNRIIIAATLLIGWLATSCISNDLPYPWVQPNVTEFAVAPTDAQGHPLLSGRVTADSVTRTITIPLTEWANIKAVPVEKVVLSDGSVCLTPEIFDSPLDLTTPLTVDFSLYERVYTWTISATQSIDRYFTIASQIGTPVFDLEAHTVTTAVPTQQPLDDILVRSIMLAGPLSTMTPDLTGQHVDFTEPVKIDVEEFGATTTWTITIHQTDVSVVVDRADAWTEVAWLYASAEVGKDNGFQYRTADAQDWIDVPQDWITHDGGAFSCCLRGLEPLTDYTVRAYSDEDFSTEVNITTQENVQLPNATFTHWWLNGKVWNPWAEDGESFWDTGNRGAATLGNSNSLPIEDAFSATGYAGAELQTKFIGLGALGKLAAGNLFAGTYVRTDGTNGVLGFGRPFTVRPTGVKVRLQYTPVAITHTSRSNPDFSYMKGEPDTCIVWAALTDMDAPYEIRTKPSDRQLFDRDNEGVIAYGQYQNGDATDGVIEVVIPIEYKATNRVPTYLLLTASASKYGDYFTGGNGSVLTILSYELLYDFLE